MSIFELVKTQQVTARKAKDATTAGILTIILGELGRGATNIEITDQAVFAVCSKVRAGVVETNKLAPSEKLEREIVVLDSILAHKPAMASAEVMELSASIFVKDNTSANMGSLMKHLRAEFGDKFDGAVAKQVATKLLSR